MTETEILRQIVQKQDELIIIDDNIITVNSLLRYVDSFSTQEIKLENERDFLYEKYRDIKNDIASLLQQLEKSDHSEDKLDKVDKRGGWICPRCQKVHSWLSMTCDCPPNVITASTTKIIDPSDFPCIH